MPNREIPGMELIESRPDGLETLHLWFCPNCGRYLALRLDESRVPRFTNCSFTEDGRYTAEWLFSEFRHSEAPKHHPHPCKSPAELVGDFLTDLTGEHNHGA